MYEATANEKITAHKVRVIFEDINEVCSLNVAQKMADEAGLDLIQINDADIPVVKIMDLNKYNYENAQREKEQKRKQKNSVIQVKEIQIGTSTQENDLKIKFKKCSKFLSEGKQVRIVMQLQSRRTQESVHSGIQQLQSYVEQYCQCEYVQDVNAQGNNIVAIIKAK